TSTEFSVGKTQRMPSITARWPIHGRPPRRLRGSRGRSGSILAHCTSVKREALPLRPVRNYLRKTYEQHRTEVPFYEHRIDVYGYWAATNDTVAVELKLRNWRKALQQALVYQLCSDYVFIAVPAATAERVDLEMLREHGIGLLAVDRDTCTEHLPART